jgi:hypothetical protein
MKNKKRFPRSLPSILLLLPAMTAAAANVAGTVHNQTTGKPSAGDSVVLVDVQAGMAEAATGTTDGQGRYSLNAPGSGPYLVRVDHQGASYFIAAPGGGAPGDVKIYDAAPKIEGVAIDADMLLIEASNGSLRVQERYLIRNTSSPPRTQFAAGNNFEVVIPSGAILDGAFATRPGGLGTNTHLTALSSKGHYSFNVPIQPDQGEKETLFEVQYHIAYNGKFAISPQLSMPADNLVIYMPHSMKFSGGSGFQPSQENPALQTFIKKGVQPGQAVSFTVEGEGSVPREQQASGSMPAAAEMTGQAAPGGGIGPPIKSPDSLSSYKGWILAGIALALTAGAAYFLRRRPGVALPVAGAASHLSMGDLEELSLAPPRPAPAARAAAAAAPAAHSDGALLNVIKEEMFSLEKEHLTGAISEAEYTQAKTGLEALLKRTLRRG